MLTSGVAPATGKIASAADRGFGVEGPVGVPASADNTESGVFHVRDRTISAPPSAYVTGPVKVENPHGFRGFKSLRLRAIKKKDLPFAGIVVKLAFATHAPVAQRREQLTTDQ